MSSTKKIARFVDVKQRQVDAAEAQYAMLRNATAAAEEAVVRAEGAWLEAASTGPEVATIDDLEMYDMHVRNLRRAVETAYVKVGSAKAAEQHAHQEMVAARTELRRFETWLDREKTAQTAEVRRRERLAEDAVAARKRSLG